jgi:hypothetical protein
MPFHPYLDSQDYLARIHRRSILERQKKNKELKKTDINKQKENIGR